MTTRPLDSTEGTLRNRLRERIVSRRLVSEDDLSKAEAIESQRRIPLHEALVALGTLTEDQVGMALAEAVSLPYVIPYANSLESGVLDRCPVELMKRHRFVPLATRDGHLVIAGCSPMAPQVLGEIEKACGHPVILQLASRRRIDSILSELFGGDATAPAGAAPAAEMSGVALLYSHLARAIEAGATEIRFEPESGAITVRYRMAGKLREQIREPLSMMLPLVTRARVLIEAGRDRSKPGKDADSFGVVRTRVGSRDATFTITIQPVLGGESIYVKFAAADGRSDEKESRSGASPSSPPAKGTLTLDRSLASVLRIARDQGASDVHLASGSPPILRGHGQLRRLAFPDGTEAAALFADDVRHTFLEVLTDTEKSGWDTGGTFTFSRTLPGGLRCRTHLFRDDRGPAAHIRLIPAEPRTSEDLDLPDAVRRLASVPQGLVVLASPPGQGKSTTAAAILDQINTSRRIHLMTIESPIEVVHQSKAALIRQLEVPRHARSLEQAIEQAGECDVDVLFVDPPEGASGWEKAVRLAEEGRFVLITLPAASATGAIGRILALPHLDIQASVRAGLSESLQAVVFQTLKFGVEARSDFEMLTISTSLRAALRSGDSEALGSAFEKVPPNGAR